jgi:2-aminoadipate transaminase
MINSIDRFLSRSGKSTKRSAIREILKHLQKPGMISFAGGLPAPETFPVEELNMIIADVLRNEGAESLQYGTTEGEPALRNALAGRYLTSGMTIHPENILITTGSQQAIDLAARIFIDPGDYILCGLPSYLGALNTFLTYGAKLKGIPLDESGINPAELERTVDHLRQLGRKVKLIYIIPDFQNPSGITVPEQRREQIISIAEKYDLLIIEDSPYREVRFEGEPQKMMFELDHTGRVLTFCTFSKIFAPGFRIGWVMANPVILDKLVMAKQTSDLCTSAFLQRIIAHYIDKGLLEKNITKTIGLYRSRRDFMLRCLSEYMPAGVTWTKPQGGLFLFLTLPAGVNGEELLKRSLEKNVAFVPGSTFFCNNTGQNTMRINFSFSGNDKIEEGIKRLAAVIIESKSGK